MHAHARRVNVDLRGSWAGKRNCRRTKSTNDKASHAQLLDVCLNHKREASEGVPKFLLNASS
jgi:hypothetical protein